MQARQQASLQPGFAVNSQLQDFVSWTKANFNVVVFMNDTTVYQAFSQRFLNTFLRTTRTRGGANTARAAFWKNLSWRRAHPIERANSRLDAQHSALAFPVIVASLQAIAQVCTNDNKGNESDKPDQNPNSLEVKNRKQFHDALPNRHKRAPMLP
jgi:hypothetical protein